MRSDRVLYVGTDPVAAETVERSLASVDVAVDRIGSRTGAIAKLETGDVGAIVIDAATVDDVPRLLTEATERKTVPTFLCWAREGGAVLASASATPVGTDRRELASTITEALGDERGPPLSATVDEIRTRLADATSPGRIERAIREELSAAGTIEFAWVGEYDRGERGVLPWVTEPSGDWPVTRSFPIGNGSEPLLESAMETGELRVRDPTDDPSAVPLGETALERDVERVAVAPLAGSDELYGVLVCYASGTLGGNDRDAIEAIARTTSHALEGIAVRGRLAQLEQTLRRYEGLVETAGDGMYVLDADGHFTTVNRALVELTGYSREGLLGEHAQILFGQDGARKGSETVERLARTDESTSTVELAFRPKRGDPIPCETQLAPLVYDGEIGGSVGVVRDVTERKRRERRLRQQNERLDAFASIVSHDLRNPLSVAKGYADLIAESDSSDEVEAIVESLDRMDSIITDVLSIAREGDWVDDTEPIDVGSAAEDAWANVSTAEASLVVDESIAVEADRSPFLRLFENLFRNSIDHGGDGVTVRVGVLPATAGDDETQPAGFYVEDDGVGIPDGMRERVFDAEFSAGSDGIGIGLWVVREVATGHGWSAIADASAEGGARFEFRTAE